MKSISLGPYCVPSTAPGTGVPVFKELVTGWLFTTMTVTQARPNAFAPLEREKPRLWETRQFVPSHEAQTTTCGQRANTQAWASLAQNPQVNTTAGCMLSPLFALRCGIRGASASSEGRRQAARAPAAAAPPGEWRPSATLNGSRAQEGRPCSRLTLCGQLNL